MELTLRWAERTKKYFEDTNTRSLGPYVVRGERVQPDAGAFRHCAGRHGADLRKESAERTIEIGFPGYAIGGLSVGEPRELTCEVVEVHNATSSGRQATYLMGWAHPKKSFNTPNWAWT